MTTNRTTFQLNQIQLMAINEILIITLLVTKQSIYIYIYIHIYIYVLLRVLSRDGGGGEPSDISTQDLVMQC